MKRKPPNRKEKYLLYAFCFAVFAFMLFPAIVVRHVTVGAGYAFNPASSVDFTLSKGLNSSAVNPQNNVTSTMRQLNWQWMYSYRY